MPSQRRIRIGLGLLLLLQVSGCAQWTKRPRLVESPLRPASASDDSVTLEIFYARFPQGDEELNGPLWKSVDEQQLPFAVRRELQRNGFRAGLLSGQLPASLTRLLKITDTAPTDPEQLPAVSLEEEPSVRRRLLQLRCGHRGEILASSVHDQLDVLLYENGQVRGRTYRSAQGLFGVQARLAGDGRVNVLFSPELHYGEPRRQLSGRDGIMHIEMSRAREIFPQLSFEALLAPGQMLIMTSLPDHPGLGHCFLDEASARGKEQKMLVVRLMQTPPAELYLEPALTDGH